MELVRVPLVNANEDEVEVVEVRVEEGQAMRAGDVVCVVETSKASMDVETPCAGYARKLNARKGQRMRVGSVICAVTSTAGEPVAMDLPANPEPSATSGAERATRKARELAAAHGVAIETIPSPGILTEAEVRKFLETSRGRARPAPRLPLKAAAAAQALVLYGASGHAKVLIDLIRSSCRELTVVAAVADDDCAEEVMGVPVVGDSSALAELRAAGVAQAALGIGSVTNHPARRRFYQMLVNAKFTLPNLVHRNAMVEASVKMADGNQIFAGAIVGAASRIGENCIINSGAVVSHDCAIGSHTHLAPGCILAGGVEVGENTLVGMGVTVYLGVRVGSNALIANGASVMKDVPDGAVVRATARGMQA